MIQIDSNNYIKSGQSIYYVGNIPIEDVIFDKKYNLKLIHLTEEHFKGIVCNKSTFSLPDESKGDGCKKWGYLKAIKESLEYYYSLPSEDRPLHIIEAYEKILRDFKEEYDFKNIKKCVKHIEDLVIMNPDLTCFVTLTFNEDKIDRHNPEEIYKKTRIWLSNKVQRSGLKYILVPEFHKIDEKGVHLHLVTNDVFERTFEDVYRVKNPLNPEKYIKKPMRIQKAIRRGLTEFVDYNKKVYNISKEWEYGWSSLEDLEGERVFVARYVTKYITEAMRKYDVYQGRLKRGALKPGDIFEFKFPEKIFGKWFLSSRNLINKPIIELVDAPSDVFDDCTGKAYENVWNECCYKYFDNFKQK